MTLLDWTTPEIAVIDELQLNPIAYFALRSISQIGERSFGALTPVPTPKPKTKGTTL
jgi:hypothetical protein